METYDLQKASNAIYKFVDRPDKLVHQKIPPKILEIRRR